MDMKFPIENEIVILKLSEDTLVSEESNIVTFNISRNNYKEYFKVKNLCKYDIPFDLVLIWTSYKNINYGMCFENFIMENISNDVCENSTFYGKSETSRRISNREYIKYERKNKIKKILNS
jgi:hypothetical protein